MLTSILETELGSTGVGGKLASWRQSLVVVVVTKSVNQHPGDRAW